jgi:hypothetical protein
LAGTGKPVHRYLSARLYAKWNIRV